MNCWGIDGAEKRSEVQAGGAEERKEEAEPEENRILR